MAAMRVLRLAAERSTRVKGSGWETTQSQRVNRKQGTVVHICHPSTPDAKAGELR